MDHSRLLGDDGVAASDVAQLFVINPFAWPHKFLNSFFGQFCFWKIAYIAQQPIHAFHMLLQIELFHECAISIINNVEKPQVLLVDWFLLHQLLKVLLRIRGLISRILNRQIRVMFWLRGMPRCKLIFLKWIFETVLTRLRSAISIDRFRSGHFLDWVIMWTLNMTQGSRLIFSIIKLVDQFVIVYAMSRFLLYHWNVLTLAESYVSILIRSFHGIFILANFWVGSVYGVFYFQIWGVMLYIELLHRWAFYFASDRTRLFRYMGDWPYLVLVLPICYCQQIFQQILILLLNFNLSEKFMFSKFSQLRIRGCCALWDRCFLGPLRFSWDYAFIVRFGVFLLLLERVRRILGLQYWFCTL